MQNICRLSVTNFLKIAHVVGKQSYHIADNYSSKKSSFTAIELLSSCPTGKYQYRASICLRRSTRRGYLKAGNPLHTLVPGNGREHGRVDIIARRYGGPVKGQHKKNT
jgi:hypothetical protein